MVVLAACGGARPGPAAVGNADPGQLAVSGDEVSLTLTGVTSVSTSACDDLVRFAIEDGGAWVDVTRTIDEPEYWLDGERFSSGVMDPFAPCCREVRGAGGRYRRGPEVDWNIPGRDTRMLFAPLTGFRRTGDRDGLPEYEKVDLRGDVLVTFSYSFDGCATFRTFTGTIHR